MMMYYVNKDFSQTVCFFGNKSLFFYTVGCDACFLSGICKAKQPNKQDFM